jgi:acetate kinase
MSRNILVINCGSSSIKFALVNEQQEEFLLSGLAEKLGNADSIVHFKSNAGKSSVELNGGSHKEALAQILPKVQEAAGGKIDGIGHRIVHGGEQFTKSVQITQEVIDGIKKVSALAPLHNPASLIGIEAVLELYPNVFQVAVFDTSFHQTMPPVAFRYAVPEVLYTNSAVRRYGFHGTSHKFVSNKAAQMLGKDIKTFSCVVAHLGNGCSTCAVENGISVDTSMGLTPLEGVAMGTRSGDVDPNLHGYLIRTLGWSLEQVEETLNKQSGLLGLSGLSNDARTLEEACNEGHKGAILALEVFSYRVAKSIASMACGLSKIDALVFTGGIGENSSFLRGKIVHSLKVFGFELNEDINKQTYAGRDGVISASGSKTVIVVPTNEERQITTDTLALLG